MNKLSELFAKFFGHINVSGVEALGIKGLQAMFILLAAFWISRMIRRFIDRGLRHDDHNDEAAIDTYKRVARFIIMVPGILLAVHVLGINLSSLFTTSGLFAVALAFAMKNIAENYVSGIMLRFERTIKPGDVLESEGEIMRVQSIGFHATIVRTKDEKDLLIPNSQLVQNRVANYTYRDSLCRVETTVGVAYASDLKEVREVLERVCNQFDGTPPQHKPVVLLSDFGDSAVNFMVRIWIENPWDRRIVKSNLNEAIWWGLKDAGIVIAYPQLDVHFDEAIKKATDHNQA
ncbi:MAG: mechanosensitive ion channel [Deltaproteobacteria bacterium]|nr:mechanosensitive ion channel [Deltaproteobacteria bacterium]